MIVDAAKKLFDGLTPERMTYLSDISHYNSNYYSINGKLLYAESDDDNFTQWYWVRGDRVFSIGGSYATDGDRIIVDAAYT